MEKEDPLQKIAREALEKQGPEEKLRRTMKILAAVAAVLFVLLAYIWISKALLVNDLKIDKKNLTEQIESLQSDYEALSSDYESINSQLDSSREEIAQLVDRIKKTEATNRRKMRQYEKELGTLRSIMRSYIVQIDSLNTLNQQLAADAAAAKKEAAESRRRNAKLTKEVATLSGQVAAGAVIKARGITLAAYDSHDRVTDRSSRVVRLLVNLSLVENEIAPRGPVRVYVRVTAPDGTLLNDGKDHTFKIGGQALEGTASREVDYEGAEVEMGVYVNNVTGYRKGVYTVEVFTEQSRLGSAEMLLR